MGGSLGQDPTGGVGDGGFLVAGGRRGSSE